MDISGTLKSADASTSTAGNDTFNAILGAGATLNTFDNINAGAGTDTLNIVDSTAAAFAMPVSATLSSLETVNVSRSAAAADTSIGVTVTDTTFGTGVKTLNIVEAGLATNATAVAGASVTLNSATNVSVISTGAAKFIGVAVTDTSTVAASTGSTLNTVTLQGVASTNNTLTGNGIATVNLNDVATLTTVTAAAGTRAVTVNTTGTAGIGGFTDATATTLSINSNGTAAMALGTFTAAKATTVNYASSVIGNTSLTLTAALATTLNVSGTKVATMTMTGNTVLATVNVTGSAGLTTDLTAGATAVTLLDTTGTTEKSIVTLNTATAVNGGAGADFITVAATTKAVNLGAGNDQATVSVTALGTGGSISGGDGTDELVLTNANAVTLSTAGAGQTAFRAAVTSFEILNIGTQSGSTVSATGAGTFTTIKMTSATAAQILSNVTSGQTVEMVYGAAGTSVTTNALTSPTDSLTVKLGGDLSGGARVFGVFATPGTETVNIVMSDTNTTFTTRQATATLVDSAATYIIVTGNNGLTLTHQLDDAANASTNLTNLNASGLTKGAISYTSGVLTTDATVVGSLLGGDTLNFGAATSKINMTATAGTNTLSGSLTFINTITGGSGADTITGGSAVDTINGGAGADIIIGRAGNDVLTGGTGSDDFRMVTGIANGTDSITDFTKGTGGDIFTVSVGATGITAMKDGNSAAQAAGAATLKEVSAATTLAAGQNVFALTGATFATAALAQAAIEVGGSRALTFASATTAGDDIILLWSDGTLGHISLVNIASGATTITAANATIADAATLVGVTSIGAVDFVSANFVFIA